jgi:hypothetical protein
MLVFFFTILEAGLEEEAYWADFLDCSIQLLKNNKFALIKNEI